jgi:RsbRD-like negative regulator of sigma factor
MPLDTLLTEARSSVLDEAYAVVERSDMNHYERAGEAFTRAALDELFTRVVDAIRTRDLGPLVAHVEHLATERFEHGFDISEVQIAVNALELAMWRRIVSSVPLEDLAEAIGLLSTALGAGKDALTRKYVSLASRRHVTSLDLSALFDG